VRAQDDLIAVFKKTTLLARWQANWVLPPTGGFKRMFPPSIMNS
jgi:hypothetical protein